MIGVMCLAMNIYFEARNQPIDGQMMVAEVTLNRVQQSKEPTSICEVVWKDKQFSWTHDGKSDKPHLDKAFYTAILVASEAMEGETLHTGATHYHNTSVEPVWAKGMIVLGKYGDHIFYKDRM